MGLWDRALDAAGVGDPNLREDYTQQRKLVAGYRRSSYLAVRLLLPPPLLPHVIAATAFMHRTDTLLDSGPVAERAGACAEWVKEVRDGLAGGESDHAAVRPLLHTLSAHPGMRGRGGGWRAPGRRGGGVHAVGPATGATPERDADVRPAVE
ncbi:squalene/phytoene synthase family protein, partial [Streptomyces sp. NPDC059455]|uniref:squalene/phytoene synthase family protein n=1 Tax=Streptomyces sp. NPDC059455 TaxID=3346837 RepID=UPI0036944ACD